MLPDLEIWLNHFEYHAARLTRIPEGIPDVLSADERRLIASSIATFQLGEQSEGGNLLRAAWRFARTHDAAPLFRITELFIREEQHHAALLRAFMERHAIPLKHHDWTDRIFRRIRRCAGFELCVSVLVAAELIGIVYYRALEVATGCGRLKALCRALVADELAHVAFESDLLLAIRAPKPAAVRVAAGLLHHTLVLGASFVVWHTHRAVLRRAGYRRGTFLNACSAQYSFYLQKIPVGHAARQCS